MRDRNTRSSFWSPGDSSCFSSLTTGYTRRSLAQKGNHKLLAHYMENQLLFSHYMWLVPLRSSSSVACSSCLEKYVASDTHLTGIYFWFLFSAWRWYHAEFLVCYFYIACGFYLEEAFLLLLSIVCVFYIAKLYFCWLDIAWCPHFFFL